MDELNLRFVYEQLKKQYCHLTFTNTGSLPADEGFTDDFPIIIGRAAGRLFWLYVYENEYVFSEDIPGKKYHNHWHPQDDAEAIADVLDWMKKNTAGK